MIKHIHATDEQFNETCSMKRYQAKKCFTRHLVYFTSGQFLFAKLQFLLWITVLAKLWDLSVRWYVVFGAMGFFLTWGIGFVFEILNLRKYFMQETYKDLIK